MPALGSGVRLSRKFHRGVMANNKLAISIINNEKTVSLSWPSVDNSQSYQIAYKPTSADEYNLVVSSKNFTVLNNLKEKAYHYSISPVDQEKGLLGPIYSGDITMEVSTPPLAVTATTATATATAATAATATAATATATATATKSDNNNKNQPDAAQVSDITPLEIRVGKIVAITKHPDADKLYIEQIDCGEEGGPRTIVSGLVPYCSETDLLHKKVLVLCNLKPRPLQGVLSHGMVLCASDQTHEHVDPVTPPAASSVGELVYFRGHVSDPKPPGNAAVKAFKRVAGRLLSNSVGVANFDGEPFMTKSGPCTTIICDGKVS